MKRTNGSVLNRSRDEHRGMEFDLRMVPEKGWKNEESHGKPSLENEMFRNESGLAWGRQVLLSAAKLPRGEG